MLRQAARRVNPEPRTLNPEPKNLTHLQHISETKCPSEAEPTTDERLGTLGIQGSGVQPQFPRVPVILET